MSMTLSSEAVLALAPDATSAKAARRLLAPSQWPTLGANDKAVWGECQGSGAKPYQTQVDRDGPVFRCSCPSRKFPCKHGLALLLMHAESPGQFKTTETPSWVSDWLTSRADKAQKKEEKQRVEAAKPVDPEAAARAAAQRWQRIDKACDDLQRWLCDQVERGLGVLTAQQRPEWEGMAARLVDAQAPGLASRVREAAACLGDRTLPAETMLRRLGVLDLACNAVRHREQLAEDALADLRVLMGWPLEKADVIASTTPVLDRWIVLGQAAEEREGKLTERRVWLHGARSGRRALILDHAFGGKGFERAWLNGTAAETELAFYPGAAGLRALAVSAELQPAPAQLPASQLSTEWDDVAARIARCPWIPLHPVLCTDAIPVRIDGHDWLNCHGQRIPLAISEADLWPLLTLSGGQPISIMCEWDGNILTALSAEGADGRWQRALT